MGYLFDSVAVYGQRYPCVHVFKMVANVNSSDSYSSLEDSASEDSSIDPIKVAKPRGADIKELEKAAIARGNSKETRQEVGKMLADKRIVK